MFSLWCQVTGALNGGRSQAFLAAPRSSQQGVSGQRPGRCSMLTVEACPKRYAVGACQYNGVGVDETLLKVSLGES